MTATILVLSLSPLLSTLGIVGILFVVLVLVIINGDRRTPNVPELHDCEAEIQRITRQVRFRSLHPWKARAARVLGID